MKEQIIKLTRNGYFGSFKVRITVPKDYDKQYELRREWAAEKAMFGE